jgi:hypothetical protein
MSANLKSTILREKTIPDNIVKPVFNDYPWDPKIVVIVDR